LQFQIDDVLLPFLRARAGTPASMPLSLDESEDVLREFRHRLEERRAITAVVDALYFSDYGRKGDVDGDIAAFDVLKNSRWFIFVSWLALSWILFNWTESSRAVLSYGPLNELVVGCLLGWVVTLLMLLRICLGPPRPVEIGEERE
jgi:hypothetical protein